MKELDKNRFLLQASQVLNLVRQELSQSSPKDPMHTDLQYASERITEMRNDVAKESLPPNDQRFAKLARLIVDTWPLHSELGAKIVELERSYRFL